jgi:hypothetical protein
MPDLPVDRFQEGERVSAADLNELRRQAAKAANLRGPGVGTDNAQLYLRPVAEGEFLAKVTAVESGPPYAGPKGPRHAWVRMLEQDNGDSLAWTDAAGTLSDLPLFENNGRTIPVNELVYIRPGPGMREYRCCWGIAGGCLAVRVCVSGVEQTMYLRIGPGGALTLTSTPC